MDFLSGMGEISETAEIRSDENRGFSKAVLDKFDKIMGDDKLDSNQREAGVDIGHSDAEDKFRKMFDVGDFFERKEEVSEQQDLSEKREPNLEYEIAGVIYETDDNGDIYKKNGELLPNQEYTVKGNVYTTDGRGNKVSCDSEPEYTEDGTRNIKEQVEAGGEERQEDDDGGHIIAKILGGAEGEENLVPMRRTLNRGDYKKMENEIAKALQEGKKVTMHVDLKYNEDSGRPSTICAEYDIDKKKTIVEFDNKKLSTELLDSLDEKICDEDYNSLTEELEDMKADGIDGSVTSVKVGYDEAGTPVKVTVGILEEATGRKTYKVYEPR